MIRRNTQNYKQKRRRKTQAGFTLAELMLTVGILVVLMAFAFVALIQYQKSLKLTEMDNTAKEIFVAAQNHMTAMDASGEWAKLEEEHKDDETDAKYFGETLSTQPGDFDEEEAGFTWGDGSHKFYYVTYNPKEDTKLEDSVLADILPFGAIDDTVRSGGSYVIEYEYTTASVYGVFYTDKTDDQIKSDYEALNDARSDSDEAKTERKSHKPIIGYYGGAAAKKLKSTTLAESDLDVKVNNADKLQIVITDKSYKQYANATTRITVYISGEESGKKATYALELKDGSIIKKDTNKDKWWEVQTKDNFPVYTLTLDDITTVGGHFADIFKEFNPGENLSLRIKESSDKILCNSLNKTAYTNSLFEASYPTAEGSNLSKVTISNIRHLQNLSPEVSNLLTTTTNLNTTAKRAVTSVEQTKDLEWDWTDKSIYLYNSDSTKETIKAKQQNAFVGIVNDLLSEYNGNNYAIRELTIIPYEKSSERTSYGGLFAVVGSIQTEQLLTIKNLTLDNFIVNASGTNGTSGALVGAVYANGGATVTATNVTVLNPTITATGAGNAGGLIGTLKSEKADSVTSGKGGMIENCAVYFTDTEATQAGEEQTAATKYKLGTYNADSKASGLGYGVRAVNGNAGGLIGSIAANQQNGKGITVSNSFAAVPVLTTSGNAGGLIGNVASTGASTIENSYAGGYTEKESEKDTSVYKATSYNVAQTGTAVADAGNAGGLIGLVSTASNISNSYSTCSVYGTTAGGLIGDDKTASKYRNSYCVGKISNQGTTYGAVIGNVVNASFSDDNATNACSYLTGISTGMGAAGNGSITGTIKEASMEELSVAEIEKSAHETHTYNSNLSTEVYPFKTVNTTARKDGTKTGVQYGDWQASTDEFEAELAYYEIYYDADDQKYSIGLYNKALEIDTIKSEETIVQDGYVALVSSDGEYQANGIVCHKVSELKDDEVAVSVLTTTRKYPGDGLYGYESDDVSDTIPLKIANGTGYYLQFLDLKTVDTISGDKYYSKLTLSKSGAGSHYFWYQPHYAMSEIQNKGTTDASFSGTNATPASISIRTERQYSMMTQDLQNPTTTTTISGIVYSTSTHRAGIDVYLTANYVQERDLSFGESTDYTKNYFSTDTHSPITNVTDSVATLNPLSAAANLVYYETRYSRVQAWDTVGFSGIYDGKQHTITNLSIKGENNKSAGMFGNTKGALIQNLKLVNMNVSSSANSQYTGSVVGNASHYLNTSVGSKRINTVINDVTVSNAIVNGAYYVGGLCGAGYSMAVDGIVLSGNSVSGTAVIGGCVGIISNMGQNNTNHDLVYQNITQINCTVNEENVHSSDEQSIGTGGFIGKVMPMYSYGNYRNFKFINIAIDSQKVNVLDASNSDSVIAASLWMGCLEDSKKNRYQIDESSFQNQLIENGNSCEIKNSELHIQGLAEDGANASYGTLYGLVQSTYTEGKTRNMPLDVNVTTSGCKINAADSLQEGYACSIGGVVGKTKNVKLVLKTIPTSYLGTSIEGFTTDHALAIGGWIGIMDQTNFNTNSYEFKSLEVTGDSAAENYGGFVGKASQSDIKNLTVGNVVLNNNQSSRSQNEGGIVGNLYSSNLSNIKITGKIAGSPSDVFGGVVGTIDAEKKMGVGEITDITVGNTASDVRDPAGSIETASTNMYGGAIGQLSSGNVEKVLVQNVKLTDLSSLGNGASGGVVGQVDTTGVIKNSSADNIAMDIASGAVGGFAGKIANNNVLNCDVRLSVIANNESVSDTENYLVSGGNKTGGFVGTFEGGAIAQCFAAIPVTTKSTEGQLGGFAGYIEDGTITECYASGNVTGQNSTTGSIGGFAGSMGGKNNITDSYATGNVENGQVLAGFIGTVFTDAKLYVNNCYSLGTVAQNSVSTYGGFLGSGLGALDKGVQGLQEEYVKEFFGLITLNMQTLIESESLSEADKEHCKNALNLLRIRSNNSSYNKLSDYLTNGKWIDSTAPDWLNDNYTYRYVISELLQMSRYEKLKGALSTWKIKCTGPNKYTLYYTSETITELSSGKKLDGVFEYLNTSPDTGRHITATVKNSGTYKIIEPGTATAEDKVFTGGIYLKDASYNAGAMADDAENFKDAISHHTFEEMQASGSDSYLSKLNEAKTGNGFGMPSDYAHKYNKELTDTNYSFPSLVSAVGNTTLELSEPMTKTHWGDWPEQTKVDDIGLLYYEIVDGKVYYHGYTSKYAENPENASYQEVMTAGEGLENGLVVEAGKHVSEDGYLVMVPKGTDTSKLVMSCGAYTVNDAGKQNWFMRDLVKNASVSLTGQLNMPEYDIYYLDIPTIITNGVYKNGAGGLLIGQPVDGQQYPSAMSQATIFTWTPDFADAVVKQKENVSQYYVRTTRQLYRLSQIGNTFTQKPNYTILQNLDIDFTVDLTSPFNDINQFTSSIPYMGADYIVAISTNETGTREGYIINGLQSNLFGQIQAGSEIKGITLTNSTVTKKDQTAVGFAIENAGTIDSCYIRPKESNYETVTIQTTGNGQTAVGFVEKNYNTGVIKNSAFIGTLYNEENSWRTSEGKTIGFVSTNDGKIENCYANCKLKIDVKVGLDNPSYTAGFCGTNNAIISKCYTVSESTISNIGLFTQEAGTSYGFVKIDYGEIDQCYSAIDKVTAKKIYSFSGDQYSKATNCYYNGSTNYQVDTTYGATLKTYSQMQKLAEDEGTNATKETTHRYNLDLPEIYPFAMSSTADSYLTMQHYGDWPVKPTKQNTYTVGMVYYEKIGDAYYYHGYNEKGEELSSDGTDNSTGLPSGNGKYVSESGYCFLYGTTPNINSVKIKLNGNSINQKDYIIGDEIELATDIMGYKIKADKFSTSTTDNINFSKTGSSGYDVTYTMTPYFADSVQMDKVSESTFYIRSAQDLNRLSGLSAFATNNDNVFIQQLDLDMSGTQLNKSIETFTATYKSAITYDSNHNRCGYTIKGLDKTLFEEIDTNGKVYNVTIIDSLINDNAGFVDENNGTIDSCSIRPSNNSYDSVKIGNFEGGVDTKNDVVGFVSTNNGTITNSSVVATISAENKASGFALHNAENATIDSCYVNAKISANKDITGFVNNSSSDDGGAISNCHAISSIESASEAAYGFMAGNSYTTLTNCYSLSFELKGNEASKAFCESSNQNSKDCYYLNQNIEETYAQEAYAKDYNELLKTVQNSATIQVTHNFTSGLDGVVYPFDLPRTTNTINAVPLTMQHYGDWPTAPSEARIATMSLDDSEILYPENKNQNTIHTGIAYYENNNVGYEGWYAVTDSGSGDDTPFNTLATEQNFNLADTDTSYGILIQSGSAPQVSAAESANEITAMVNIDGVDYDFYRFVQDAKHEAVHVTVQGVGADTGSSYIYNDDFAAAISAGKTLGETAENGGRPYQIRTNEQLRNINTNKALYMTSAFRQTLDIALAAENFTPLGGSDVWTEGETYAFSGSYDAGLTRTGKDLLETTADEQADASAEIPTGYTISGMNQTITFTSVDGNHHTGSDEAKNDQYKYLYGGLFASVSGNVRGVNLSGNINIARDANESYLQGCVGSVAGAVNDGGSISNVNSDVTITVDSKCLDMKLGGMVGYNDGTIQNSYYNGAIQNWYYDETHIGQLYMQNKAGYTANIGGFVGLNTGAMDKSSAAAAISLKVGDTDAQLAIYGGFVGVSGDENSSITNSWSKSVIADAAGIVGGFVGATVDYSQNANETKVTTIHNNYAIVSLQNIDAGATVGLFVGNNATSDIWKCYAAELGGDGNIYNSAHAFANGTPIDLNAQGCFTWNGLDTMPFDALNADGLWNLNNGIYPMLGLNTERESDIVKVTGAVMSAGTDASADMQSEAVGNTTAEEITSEITDDTQQEVSQESAQNVQEEQTESAGGIEE